VDITRLKEIRTSKGLTKVKIAREIGVSITAYSNWENGTSDPKPENLAKLIEVLNEEGK
jgi:putative transcriptional regulator